MPDAQLPSFFQGEQEEGWGSSSEQKLLFGTEWQGFIVH